MQGGQLAAQPVQVVTGGQQRRQLAAQAHDRQLEVGGVGLTGPVAHHQVQVGPLPPPHRRQQPLVERGRRRRREAEPPQGVRAPGQERPVRRDLGQVEEDGRFARQLQPLRPRLAGADRDAALAVALRVAPRPAAGRRHGRGERHAGHARQRLHGLLEQVRQVAVLAQRDLGVRRGALHEALHRLGRGHPAGRQDPPRVAHEIGHRGQERAQHQRDARQEAALGRRPPRAPRPPRHGGEGGQQAGHGEVAAQRRPAEQPGVGRGDEQEEEEGARGPAREGHQRQPGGGVDDQQRGRGPGRLAAAARAQPRGGDEGGLQGEGAGEGPKDGPGREVEAGQLPGQQDHEQAHGQLRPAELPQQEVLIGAGPVQGCPASVATARSPRDGQRDGSAAPAAVVTSGFSEGERRSRTSTLPENVFP